MGYVCFKCMHLVDGGTRSLALHLRRVHAISSLNEKLFCMQDGCMKTFALMNTYLRHLKRSHRERNVNEEFRVIGEPIQNPNPIPIENEHIGDNDDDGDDIPDIVQVPEDEFDENKLKILAANLVLQMRCSTSVPISFVGEIINETNTMFHHSMSHLNRKLRNLCHNHDIDVNAADVGEMFDLMDTFRNPFSGLETPKQQMKYMVNEMKLVSPTEVALGMRYDQVVDHKTGQIIQKMVTDTFQYIPVLEVLKLVLNHDKVCDLITSEARYKNGQLASYCDGVQFSQHGMFKDNPHALRLQLFYDDVEVVNPIGTKTCIHKLGMFYYSLDNLPRKYNSVMSSIHVLAVCYSMDLKKYGFHPILRSFLAEMKQLESDDGYTMELNGRAIQIHGTLTSLSADTLAAHDLMGFMGPSSNRFCRLCLGTREEIQTKFSEDEFVLRSIEQHDEHAETASTLRQGDPASGVRTTCCLNELRHFHCVTNYNLDVMHDMLEGVCPFEVKLLLYYFIYDAQFISLQILNQRIKAFNYGFCDRKNKPSQLMYTRLHNHIDHKLGQKAAQMWCFTRMLPLLIGDKIPIGNDHFELLLLLLQCMNIIFAPVVSIAQTGHLKGLIQDHHELLKSIFPDVNLINKHHHMIHYPMCMRMSGPLTGMQCMKYELKHNSSKRLGHVNCNFKNICKSVAYRHQIYQCANWHSSGLRSEVQCKGGSLYTIRNLPGSDKITASLDLDQDDEVYVAKEVTLFGTEYIPNLFVVTGINSEYDPQFSCISSLLVMGQSYSDIKIVVRNWRNIGFNMHYHCYKINRLEPPSYQIVTLDALVDSYPYAALTPYIQELSAPAYISMRYNLVKK